MMICYDGWHPEVARILKLKGADLILDPTCWVLVPGVVTPENPVSAYVHMATAHVNSLFIVCADQCGVERGCTFIGRSCIAGPAGFVAGPGGSASPRGADGGDQRRSGPVPQLDGARESVRGPPGGCLRPAPRLPGAAGRDRSRGAGGGAGLRTGRRMTPARRAGDLVFVSGQAGTDPAGGDALEKLAAALATGTWLDDVVDVISFHADVREIDGVLEHAETLFTALPASDALGTTGLAAREAQVSIRRSPGSVDPTGGSSSRRAATTATGRPTRTVRPRPRMRRHAPPSRLPAGAWETSSTSARSTSIRAG